MIDLTSMPINYVELHRDGRTITCDQNGEVIVLRYGRINNGRGTMYRVIAIRGNTEYGEYDISVNDASSTKMAAYFAIKNIHKAWKPFTEDAVCNMIRQS